MQVGIQAAYAITGKRFLVCGLVFCMNANWQPVADRLNLPR